MVKKDVNLSEESIIDEQTQNQLKDDEPVNEKMTLKIIMIRFMIIPLQEIVINM